MERIKECIYRRSPALYTFQLHGQCTPQLARSNLKMSEMSGSSERFIKSPSKPPTPPPDALTPFDTFGCPPSEDNVIYEQFLEMSLGIKAVGSCLVSWSLE